MQKLVAVVSSMCRTAMLNRGKGLRLMWKAAGIARDRTRDAWADKVAVVALEPLWLPKLKRQVAQDEAIWCSPLEAKKYVATGRFRLAPELGNTPPEEPSDMLILEKTGTQYPGLQAEGWRRVPWAPRR